MSQLDAILLALKVGAAALLIWTAALYRDHVYQLGYDAAVADGEAVLEQATAAARRTESDLRAQLRALDADAFKKEKDHAASLEAAQRRVRAGIDGLRCPAAGPIPGAAAPDDRSVAGGPEADGAGSAIVPEVAAAILGDGADVAGLVRRYERVVERFEACRAVNAGP